MNRIAALYARVSTLQQEQEATIESQIAAIEGFAHAHGYALSRELYFVDQAVSGFTLERPSLERLRNAATEGLFQVVVCLDPDRLARKYVYQWVLLEELRRVGVSVVFVTQPATADTPQRDLLLGVQGLFAEYERAMITERLRRGKLYRMRHGQLVNPVAPYGYRYVPVSQPQGGRWEVHAVEAAVVERIYLWYTEEAGMTIHQIVTRLNELGSQAPARGQRWQYSTVQAILKQEDYTGQAHYNCTRADHDVIGRPRKIGHGPKRDVTHVPRPSEEWVAIRVPPLISTDVWQRAQEKLAMKQRFAGRNNKRHFYLLRGLLVCGVCGHTLRGRVVDGRLTYRCQFGGRRGAPDTPPHSRVVAGDVVDALVWDAVRTLLDNPILIEDAWASQQETPAGDEQEAHHLRERHGLLDRQWERLVDLFQDGHLAKEEMVRRKALLDRERETLDQRLAQLTTQARREQTKEQIMLDFAAFCEQVRARLGDATPDVRQEVIRLLIDHIVVNDREIVIKHIIPADDDCRLLPRHRWTQIEGSNQCPSVFICGSTRSRV